MELEWKVPLKGVGEAPVVPKSQTPDSMASALTSSVTEIFEKAFTDSGSSGKHVAPIEQKAILTLHRPGSSGDSWHRLNIHLVTPNLMKDAAARVNPGVWIDLKAPGSIQLAVKDDQSYFGKAKLTYKKALQYTTEYGTVYDTQSTGSDVEYPKAEDPTVKEVKEFVNALADYGIGLFAPDYVTAPLGFVPAFKELEKLKSYAYDWALTTKTPYGSMASSQGVFESSDAAKSSNAVFSAEGDALWDHQTVVWDKLGDGLATEIDYCFKMHREPDAIGDTELFIRAVIPYKRIATAGQQLDRHLEFEWAIRLSDLTQQPKGEPYSISVAGSGTFRPSAQCDVLLKLDAKVRGGVASGTMTYKRIRPRGMPPLELEAEVRCLGVFANGTQAVVTGPVTKWVNDPKKLVPPKSWLILQIKDEGTADQARAGYQPEKIARGKCTKGPDGIFPGKAIAGDITIVVLPEDTLN